MHNALLIGDSLTAELLFVRLREANVSAHSIPTDVAIELGDELKTLASTADIVVICGSGRSSQSLVDALPSDAKILDISPTFRTCDDWLYGFHDDSVTQQLKSAKRVSNPGCIATATLLILRTLNSIPKFKNDGMLYVDALCGYSSGGRRLIEKMGHGEQSFLSSFGKVHYQVPEIKTHGPYEGNVLIVPKVMDAYAGTLVSVFVPNISKSMFDSALTAMKFADVVLDAENPHKMKIDYWAGKEGACIASRDISNGCHIVCCIDNLLKGCVSTAMKSISLMIGMNDE